MDLFVLKTAVVRRRYLSASSIVPNILNAQMRPIPDRVVDTRQRLWSDCNVFGAPLCDA